MSKKKTQKGLLKVGLTFKKLTLVSLIVSLILSFLISGVVVILRDRIYPGISAAGLDIGLLTKEEASLKLTRVLGLRINQPATFHNPYYQVISGEPATLPIDISNILENKVFEAKLDEAFEYGHHRFYFQPKNLEFDLKDWQIEKQLDELSSYINKEPLDAQLKVTDGQINVTPSQDGTYLDREVLKKYLRDYLNTGNQPSDQLPIRKITPKLSYDQAKVFKKRLDEIKLSPIKLKFEDQEFILDLSKILILIDLENSQSSLVTTSLFDQPVNIKSIKFADIELSDIRLTLNQKKLDDYLQTLASQINREVKEPLFSFDGKRVSQFSPPVEGRRVDIKQARERITQALITHNQTMVELPVDTIQPKNKLTNDLGIKELIGRGISHFAGSIANRIYNIELTAKKINGILIAPGEIFSFNQAVGDISAASGFRQAYVIKSGRTVLDDGGGVCQDSTTLFRAVLNAGLPVLKRTAHAYRVAYYEQGFPPGLDATVYAPSVDFQFKNDTLAHVLIQAYTSGNSLYVDLYGTSDGRVSTISTPVVTNQTPPPPELRQDDPTLPKGVVKQVDFAAWGAKVTFKRTVEKDGQVIINETFNSNFRPWQAVFLVGTKEG